MKRAELYKMARWSIDDYERYQATKAYEGERTSSGQDMQEFMMSCAATRLKSAAEELYNTFFPSSKCKAKVKAKQEK